MDSKSFFFFNYILLPFKFFSPFFTHQSKFIQIKVFTQNQKILNIQLSNIQFF